jgi:hypothetical protein
MKKIVTAVSATGVALAGFGLFAPPAQAASSNVAGWTAGTATCANGAVSVFPLVITNGTDTSQTGSYTIPSTIVHAVQVASSPSAINCNGNPDGAPNAISTNFTVPAGGTTVMWVGLGSTQQTGTASHNIGFGGLPSGTRKAAWYDLGLTLNNVQTAINGGDTFNNLTATYQGTGGIDPATSRQNGFVLSNCTTTADGSVLPGGSILTPYNSGAWTSGPSYGANQPLCAAWVDSGQFTSFTPGGSSDFTMQAAQYYGQGLVAFAGSGSAPITSAYTMVSGSPSSAAYMGINMPSSGPWIGQNAQTGEWFVANAAMWVSEPYGTTLPLELYVNGQLVGTVG